VQQVFTRAGALILSQQDIRFIGVEFKFDGVFKVCSDLKLDDLMISNFEYYICSLWAI
jgi:hypothetical protein